jgi:hypothetical protein
MALTGKDASAAPKATPTIMAKPAAVKQPETAVGQITVVMAQWISRCAVRELLQIRTPDIRSANERRHFNTGHNDWPVA